ncbi:MAG: hypothetical protein AAF624_06275 [Bacteroidota bacterium]
MRPLEPDHRKPEDLVRGLAFAAALGGAAALVMVIVATMRVGASPFLGSTGIFAALIMVANWLLFRKLSRERS